MKAVIIYEVSYAAWLGIYLPRQVVIYSTIRKPTSTPSHLAIGLNFSDDGFGQHHGDVENMQIALTAVANSSS